VKRRVLALLDGHDPIWGRTFALCLNGLIILSAVAVALETVDDLQVRYHALFLAFEIFVVIVFAIEYGLRVWAVPHRWRYVFSAAGLIDLLSFLPSLLLFHADLRAVRVLRLLRLIRLLRLLRVAIALDRLSRALRGIREELAVFGLLAAMLLYLSAVGIYFFEHEAQPDAFGSVPDSLWWAVVSLTTVGYGDIYPITTGGRIFTGFVLFLGLGVVAVPTGLISSALTQQRRMGKSDGGGFGDGGGSGSP
jgi:voltage-gated potassium channel